MMSERRREVLLQRIGVMNGFQSLAGASVLEIGADKWDFSARMLLDAGARRVVSTNLKDDWPEETTGRIEKRRIDARALDASLEPRSIDVIFGMSVLEHINGLERFFAGAKRVLKPGGLFFVHGGPIWSFATGHHVFVDGENRKYRFGDKPTNPIADWDHLLRDKQSLVDELVLNAVPPGDAERIGHWVYEDDGINRVGFRSMCAAFENSQLQEVDRHLNAFAGPEPAVLEAIENGPHGGQGRYDVSGITFIARA